MAVGILGVDSLAPVTISRVQTATSMLGVAPKFWGRYFKTATSIGQYNPDTENAVLNLTNVRVLPVARQTNNVDKDEQLGQTDGTHNAEAVISALGVSAMAAQGTQFLVFLDVEGAGNPSLSVDYFTGWSNALLNTSKAISSNAFELLPCVYGRTNDTQTWDALRTASSLGTPCFGAWVFRMKNNACQNGVVDYDGDFCEPNLNLPFPVLLWQFAIDCPFQGDTFDLNQTNTGIDGQKDFLNKLILPPIGS